MKLELRGYAEDERYAYGYMNVIRNDGRGSTVCLEILSYVKAKTNNEVRREPLQDL